MSDNPLLSKMDALLKKHRGGAGDAPPPEAPSAGAWLPVLTDVIEQGSMPAGVPPTEPPPPAAVGESPPPATLAAQAAPPSEARPQVVDDTLAEQLMSELAPRLSQIMEQQVAAELRKNLDETVATLLTQLDVNVREIVREAIAQKLKAPQADDMAR